MIKKYNLACKEQAPYGYVERTIKNKNKKLWFLEGGNEKK